MEMRIAFRNLVKRPFLNSIKIAGLALGLTGILFIILFIKNELSFDRFHDNYDRIFRLTFTHSQFLDGKHFARVYEPDFIPAMKDYFPDIENYVRISPIRGGVIKLNEKFIRINQAYLCDSTFFQVFKADLLSGNKNNILDNPASIVISEGFAREIFGTENPVGQTLTLPAGQFYGKDSYFTIRGVMKDFPVNSHFHPEFIASRERGNEYIDWAWTYLVLQRGSDPDKITKGFNSFYTVHTDPADTAKVTAFLQPLTQIHLKSNKLREIENNSNLNVIYTLVAASIILLFIALANFMNLNLGMAAFSERYLQVGRVFGSSDHNRLKYYLAEASIVIVASVVLSLLLTFCGHIILLRHLSLDLFTGNFQVTTLVIASFIVLSLITGLSSFINHEATSIFTGALFGNRAVIHRKGINKGLIVTQYAISTALMISVIVMTRQTRYALQSGMNNKAENLICLENLHTDVQSDFSLFKQETMKYNSVLGVTALLDPPGGEANDMFPFELEGYMKSENDEDVAVIGVLPCDYSLPGVFNLTFLAGEDFSPTNIDNEGSGEFIINRSAMKRLGYDQPEHIIGKNFKLLFQHGDITIPAGKITGVVEDFRLSGIKNRVEPLVLFKRNDIWLLNFIIAPQPGMNDRAINDTRRVWGKMFPEHLFEYRYISNIYRNVYKAELLQTRLISLFTIIALFISSMGLLGLSLLTTQRRTKEIGIRVVNGATVSGILVLLNWFFVKWILISFLFAIPLAWFGMQKWLENFVYKVPVSGWVFLLAGTATLVLALLTVSIRSWKAATQNPVDALRYE